MSRLRIALGAWKCSLLFVLFCMTTNFVASLHRVPRYLSALRFRYLKTRRGSLYVTPRFLDRWKVTVCRSESKASNKINNYDLSLLATFHKGFPRRLSGTGKRPSNILGVLNRTRTSRGILTRTLCRKNHGTVKTKQKTITVGEKTIYRTVTWKDTSSKWCWRIVPFTISA
jgi:hypothetical protein